MKAYELYQTHCCQHHFLVLFFNAFGSLNLHFSFKAKYPVEKHFANSNFFDNAEVLKIPGIGMNIWTKTVYDGIHYAIIAK